jgi:hypothetical protein
MGYAREIPARSRSTYASRNSNERNASIDFHSMRSAIATSCLSGDLNGNQVQFPDQKRDDRGLRVGGLIAFVLRFLACHGVLR